MREPYNPFEQEKEDYFSARRMVGMFLGVLAMLAVIILVVLTCFKEAKAQEIPATGFATWGKIYEL
jgi:hypothetical protein